jgi:hypothetical protein
MAEGPEARATSGGIAFPIVPYRADEGLVFAEFENDVGEPWWMITTPENAGEGLIRCSHPDCDRPAAQLDHLWPYQNETTLCAEHAEAYREEQRQANREFRQRLRRMPEVEAQAARVPALELDLQALREENARMRPVYEAAKLWYESRNEMLTCGSLLLDGEEGQSWGALILERVRKALKAEEERLPRCAVCGEPIPADHARMVEVATGRQAHTYCEAGWTPAEPTEDVPRV